MIDDSLVVPSGFEKFIEKRKKSHNLIIKTKDNYRCTNCNSMFKSNKKVNQICKCPKCKRNYQVKMCNLKHYVFKEDLAIFDKVNDYYIERVFELRSDFDGNGFKTIYFEWGRKIYNNDFRLLHEIMNDNVIGTIGGYYISYRAGSFNSNWKISESYYNPIRYVDEFIYYPGNIKSILQKIDKYKYSQIWTLLANVDIPCDLIYLLKNYNYSIELLIKMKLFNLALNPKTFSFGKTFEQRFFGLSKEYLPFIKKHNLTVRQLETLSILKEKDIGLIKIASEINNLRDLVEFIDVKKAIKLTNLNEHNSYEYSDYLSMLTIMKVDLKNKNIAYPKNIKKAHDEVLQQFETRKDTLIKEAIKEKAEKLKQFIYQDSKYIVFPVRSIEMLEDESSQQHNCVRTYADKIAKNDCDIYFMRFLKNQNKSLVTVEVQSGKIVQKRTKNNMSTTKEQDEFLKIWENKILKQIN